MASQNPVAEAPNIWAVAQSQFDHAADKLDLDDGMRRVLRVPQRELTVNFPVTMDDGSVAVFTGHRVQHNVSRGPGKGGIRYHQDVTLDEVLTAYRVAAEGPLAGILGYEELPLVSADYARDTRSSIVDAPSTMVTDGTLLKVYAWYDNEMGYACRMVDLACHMQQTGI